ncbi:hypothetical protein MSI_05680 [Treponema sp. JC4]|uniref:hypothetical protein n=1 Tax=Treponema sp. JC4 TaxID=1124982 RepID=UPI00025B0BDA|nr:hypothetical protein [Treponema sp. JC4]EID85749.1 hypothetical protein MSI_05680 [Treponema sp. JC4]
MKKSLLLSLISASLLSALCLSSCKAEVDYEVLKKNADYSDYYTNKDAYRIYYYKQPVTGETDLTAWERDTDADTTNTYYPAGSSASSLNNKAYEGFVYAGFIQNDTTINVYYKRCTIRYEFYNIATDTVPLFIVTGLYGMTSLKPICSDRDEAYFDTWHTKNDTLYTSYFTINADSNTVNDVSTTKWYASWKDKATVMGTSMNLINVGDVLLKDGSVIPYVHIHAMSNEQKAAAVAVLVSNSYNLKTGKNVDGKTRLIGALKIPGNIWINADLSPSLYKHNIKTTDCDGKKNMEILLEIDKDYRHNNNRDVALLYSYDYDKMAGIAGVYKNDWYLPSEKELKLLQCKELNDVYNTMDRKINEEYWTSTANGNDKVRTVVIQEGGATNDRVKDDSAGHWILPFRQLD